MKTQLTLTVEESLVESAKAYAAAKKTSLSDLIEKMLRVVVLPEVDVKRPSDAEWLKDLHPDVAKLAGVFKTDGKDYDYKEALTQALSEKYGL